MDWRVGELTSMRYTALVLTAKKGMQQFMYRRISQLTSSSSINQFSRLLLPFVVLPSSPRGSEHPSLEVPWVIGCGMIPSR